VRGALWQVFYFAQAIVLADHMHRLGLRHVHVHHANVAADVALLASAYSGGTWSLSMHGPTEFLDTARFQPGVKAERAALVACISEHTRSELAALSSHSEHFHVVRLGIDPDAIAFHEPQEREGPLRILNVARMAPPKGHAVLLEAIAALDVPFQAALVGDGPERPALEALASKLGLDDRVHFAGALPADQTLARYAEADVFCLPSFAEGLPVVFMEAMAAGVPVIASRTSGTPELVEDGVTGLLVEPGRPEEVALALVRMAGDLELRRHLARAARERVDADYDLRANVRRLRDLLEPLA
jgi:glycosyltransferase involved in cell wall biosynthesis